jgi:hypothetical protein
LLRSRAGSRLRYESCAAVRIEAMVWRRRSGMPAVDRLIVTRQFSRRYADLSPFARTQCERSLQRLLAVPDDPVMRLRPLISPDGYHELRFGYRDRAILRLEGADAILVDVASFREIARLNSRSARRLRL